MRDVYDFAKFFIKNGADSSPNTYDGNMKLQKLLSLTRQAIDEYGMIQENDKIAVGISGGKDSLTLLYALSCLRKFFSLLFFTDLR